MGQQGLEQFPELTALVFGDLFQQIGVPFGKHTPAGFHGLTALVGEFQYTGPPVGGMGLADHEPGFFQLVDAAGGVTAVGMERRRKIGGGTPPDDARYREQSREVPG